MAKDAIAAPTVNTMAAAVLMASALSFGLAEL